MEYKNLAILIVIYVDNKKQVNYTKDSLKALPKDIYKYAIINKLVDNSILDYVDNYELNDKNILSKAWNMGLKYLFKNYTHVLVVGHDSLINQDNVKKIKDFINQNKDAGFWSLNPINMYNNKVKHGDGSFSAFVIEKQTYKNTGDFDINFKPAYFEDNDYLERLWQQGYIPLKQVDNQYLHLGQGVVKTSEIINKQYSKFMQKNLEYFRKKHGKTPNHLPSDIKFN